MPKRRPRAITSLLVKYPMKTFVGWPTKSEIFHVVLEEISIFPSVFLPSYERLTALIALHKYIWRLTPRVLLQTHFWLNYMDMNQEGKLISCQQEASWPPTFWQHHMFPFCKMIQQPPGSTRTALPLQREMKKAGEPGLFYRTLKIRIQLQH